MSARSKLEMIMELKNKLFNSRLKESTDKLNRVKTKLNGLRATTMRTFKAMAGEVSVFNRALEVIGNPYVAIAAGVVALSGLFYKATTEATKFNAEFLNVRQLNLDKSQEQLKDYKTLIRDSAFETGKSAVDTAKAYYDIQSALGFYGQDVKKVFNEVANYSTATGADLNESINATTKALKAFGLRAEDTRRLLESNAKTVQVGITTFKELATVQTEFAGAAKGAGQSLDIANKVFAGFTSIAKGSAEAATMTKTAFQGLTQEATVKGLKSIGVSIYDSKGQMRDLTKVLTEVDAKFKQMSPKQVDELINKIGGPEGLRALLIKVKTGADDLFATFNAFDASQFNLDTALQNAKGDVAVLSGIVKNQFNTVMAKLGEKVLPAVAKGLEYLSDLMDKVYKNLDVILLVVRKAIIAFTAFKFTNMLLASSVGKVAIAFKGGLASGIGAATTAMKGFNAVFKANLIGLVTSLVATMATSIDDLIGNSERLQTLIEKEKALSSQNTDFIKATKQDLGKAQLNSLSKAGAQEIFDATKGRLDEIRRSTETLRSEMKNTDNPVVKRINTLRNTLVPNAEADALRAKNNGSMAGYEFNKSKVKNYLFEIDRLTRELSGGYSAFTLTEMEAKNQQILRTLKNRKLVEDENSITGGSGGEQVTAVTDRASQPRSIVINIDALNKGGINTSTTTLANKTPQEIEAWFTEAMMRVLRGVELSYE
jgi:TP901 family phage tail tape measure protein